MGQNRSSAVMAQRVEPHDSLDFFPTPLWATRALCEWLAERYVIDEQIAQDPACGEGHMALALMEYFAAVDARDVHDYGFGAVQDFLMPYGDDNPDWFITNPPFRLGLEFAITGIERAKIGVALLVRTAFLEGGKRYQDLFSQHPPSAVLQFCERVPMFKGRVDAKGSTATAYCWIVWHKYHRDCTRFDWIPPCRKRLEKPGDYPEPTPKPTQDSMQLEIT